MIFMLDTISVFTGICLVAYGLFVTWASWHYARIPSFVSEESSWPAVTLLVAARNEAAHLEKCLSSLESQQYPGDFLEIIVVNDHSGDATPALLDSWANPDKGHKVIHLAESMGKKAAIEAGVSQAMGEIILQTDADCWMGPDWARQMVGSFAPETVMVSGPVLLEVSKGSFGQKIFGRLQQLEYLGLSALGAGSMQGGMPNLANGANLAFRRSAFVAAGGFATVDHFASGDDEMLLQKFNRLGWKMRFVRSLKAATFTPVQPDWASFAAQRLRWVSKARYYSQRETNLVQLTSYLGFWFFPVAGAQWLFSGEPQWLIAGVVYKLSTDWPLMFQAAKQMNRLYLLAWFLLLEIAYIPYVLWVGLAGNFIKSYQWKGRWVK
jgi:cellulose synthase/poly-beta-1,6-N-acetylglucosamine synthase-like glycosyltransferase